jgi:hypothetical protein
MVLQVARQAQAHAVAHPLLVEPQQQVRRGHGICHRAGRLRRGDVADQLLVRHRGEDGLWDGLEGDGAARRARAADRPPARRSREP